MTWVFNDCNLETISLPASVKEVHQRSFAENANLKNLPLIVHQLLYIKIHFNIQDILTDLLLMFLELKQKFQVLREVLKMPLLIMGLNL
jgi:hypothetical protein